MNILLNIISLKFRILPRSVALFIGRLLGIFIYYCVPIRKHIAIQNIKIAFPEYSPSEVKLLLKNTCKHYGMVLIDFLRQPHLDDQNISNFVRIDKETKNKAGKIKNLSSCDSIKKIYDTDVNVKLSNIAVGDKIEKKKLKEFF